MSPNPTEDALFSTLERFHGERSWGRVLDAGTGMHSLQWIRSLETAGWTAVTGAVSRQQDLERRLGADGMRATDRIVTGNWTDEALLRGEVFDVVLADYLLGAIDGFAPYFQTRLFERLRSHVRRESGRLYVVGLEPYPDRAADPGGQLVLEIARLRDACILLAGHRCYREYPREWVHRTLAQAGFEVDSSEAIPIVYRRRFVDGQLDVCVRKLPFITDLGLRASLKAHIESLRTRAHAHLLRVGTIPFGADYVIAASRIDG
ncbi:MAG: hypothetical protein CL927_19960 [Deltaproteobacteria bacterium]|nr:hypothetical protein [Deltaproteobacteria bacterium]HCH65672.1 hypothetical protein [Deltaproteobacteria bacterium]